MSVLPCVTIAVALLVAATASDIALRMVPNWVCVGLGLDGLTVQAFAHSIPFSLLALFATFIPAAVCWRHGFMGGGDVKLLSAATLLVPPHAVLMLVLAVALAGGMLGVVYWTMTQLSRSTVHNRPRHGLLRVLGVERYRIRRGFSLPYAVAISIGTLYVLGESLAA